MSNSGVLMHQEHKAADFLDWTRWCQVHLAIELSSRHSRAMCDLTACDCAVQYFGELSLLRDEPRAATVRAHSDVTLLEMDKEDFERTMGGLNKYFADKAKANYGMPGIKEKEITMADLKQVCLRSSSRTTILFVGWTTIYRANHFLFNLRQRGSAEPHRRTGQLCRVTWSTEDNVSAVQIGTLGQGAFGKVWMVQWKGNCYALKKIPKSRIAKASLVTHVKAEKRLMAECDSPFLVNLVAAFQDKTQLYMLMELVQGGELFAFMRKRKRAFRESWAKFYAASVICAFEYLGAHNIVYRYVLPATWGVRVCWAPVTLQMR